MSGNKRTVGSSRVSVTERVVAQVQVEEHDGNLDGDVITDEPVSEET